MNKKKSGRNPLRILMISVHGLLRGHDPEMGRDADTGGQITYVLDLAKELGKRPEIGQVDILTRLIEDPDVSPDYAVAEEVLAPTVRIRRLPFGPKRYLRKELLWNHLDQLTDRCLHSIREQGWVPDVIHSHYADAGYVGRQLSQLLGVPLIHTGHSLGRCKRQRLLDSGRKASAIDSQFQFDRRIDEEERTLAHADLVITSTTQERDEQYGLYERFDARRCVVLPPGVDLGRFAAPPSPTAAASARLLVDRFLHEPSKPMILTLCRPAPRKNLLALLEAYGQNKELQEKANLVIMAGQRDDLRTLEKTQAEIIRRLLLTVDRYDLYGKVALPKRHTQEEVREMYRLAAKRRGVFVNPALTEPFGLTLLEAATSGLPVVATEDGGPRDILANCRNGLLVNPLDKQALATTLWAALDDPIQWRTWARAGKRNVARHYSWQAHTAQYIKNVDRVLHKARKGKRRSMAVTMGHEIPLLPLPLSQGALISDIDNTLLGDEMGLATLQAWRTKFASTVVFGIASGRTVEGALKVLRQGGVRTPDIFITSVGSEIHYGTNLVRDIGWKHYIQHRWRREDLANLFKNVPGLTLQEASEQREFKLSYYVDPAHMLPLTEIEERIRTAGLHANLIYSHERFLDVLPMRASKGRAIRYLAYKFGLPLERFLVAGDSGNDTEMMIGDTLGVIVSNYSPEVEKLRGHHHVYFATTAYAQGIMEGIQHYRFGERPSATHSS